MTLTVTPDRALVRSAGKSQRHVLVEIEAPISSTTKPRLPLNFALVIDRSGSMNGAKIEQARNAALYALGLLTPRDRIAVVAYDDVVDVLLPGTPATPDAVAAGSRRIDQLHSRGCTNLSGGWLAGCREIAEHLDGEQIARCLLLTDGLANRGITDHEELAQHATELRARGIVTSTFGIGRDFDEVLLSTLANNGGGTFRLVREAEEIPALIREEFQEGFDVVAARAELQIIAPAGVRITSLNDFPITTSADNITVLQLGDLVSGQSLSIVVGCEFPAGREGETVEVRFSLQDRDATLPLDPTTVGFRYAGHQANDDQSRDRNVDRRVAALHAAKTRRHALRLNRDGDFRGAERAIQACARRIRQYAGEDSELRSIAQSLDADSARMGRDMDVMARKMGYSRSTSDLKMRSSSGATIRRKQSDSLIVVPCSRESANAASDAVRAFERAGLRFMGQLQVTEIWPRPLMALVQGQILEPVQENRVVDAANARWDDAGIRVVLTDAQLKDNWFSHWHAAGRTAVVSLCQVSELVGVDLAAFVAYEMLLNGLNNVSPRYDMMRLAHPDTRGCLFDFCGDKLDMEIKLQSMHLCASCADEMRYLGINQDELAVATDVIRELARPRRASAAGRN